MSLKKISGIICLGMVFILFLSVNYVLGQRDPYRWPFAKTSIWNMPVHEDADYVDAKIVPPEVGAALLTDEDYILLTPDAPMTPVYVNYTRWEHYGDRCVKEGHLLFEAPIPDDFVVSPDNWLGETPNGGVAILMPDRVTLKQTQPFARCEAGGYATSRYVWNDLSLYGDGIYGAHGGSSLSAIGGTIRLGELVPGGEIKHALKIIVYGAKFLYYDEETRGCRWPARVSDGYAPDMYGQKGDPVKDVRMGALLALPKDLNLENLSFETGNEGPAMILARALRSYGAYIIDDPYAEAVMFATEWSPDGRVIDEFEREWGYSFETGTDTPWGRDIAKIVSNLHVIANNAPETIGGGPTGDLDNRLAEPACDFGTPGSGLMCPDRLTSEIPSQAVELSANTLELIPGQSYRLYAWTAPRWSTDKNFVWESENPEIATVDNSGIVKAKSLGTTKISVMNAIDRHKDICRLSVVEEIEDDDEPSDTDFSHQMGEFYQGGIIFHLWKDSTGREHGLIASLHDLGEGPSQWGPLVSTGANSLENGAENTAIIVENLGQNTAAALCDNYSAGGYSDWYLPAIKELNLLQEQHLRIENILYGDDDPETEGFNYPRYWSSSDATENEAWQDYFPNNFFGYYRKDIKYGVRAIRKF